MTEFHHPATFQGRGVAVPFTTPMLAGARVRQSKRIGVELLVPNPSGGRGVYVLHWPGARELSNPTVYDRMLIQRISGLPRIDPATIRDAALAVALEGYAGRAAVAAAEAACSSDQAHRILTEFLLLAGLIEQVEPTGRTATVLEERTPDFDRRAGLVLRRIAPSLGCAAAHLTIGIAAMGTAFAPIGIGADDRTARISRLIARLGDAHAGLLQWLSEKPDTDVAGLGRAVAGTMKLAHDGAKVLLAHARTMLADPVALLRRWIADAQRAVELAARCDWLLDGWERICLLWKIADSPASQRASLLEMAQLLPVLPSEVTGWLPIQIHPAATDPPCRVFSRNDTWRSGGAALALIQRNETLRAMSI